MDGYAVSNQKYRIGDMEEVISYMDLYHIPDSVMEQDENHRIDISSWFIWVPELNVVIHEGVYCCYDDGLHCYEPDCSLFVLRECDDCGTLGAFLYYEQGGLESLFSNYFRSRLNMMQIRELACVFCVPDDFADVLENH